MSSIIRRRRGLMRVSVMGVLPELGLNTQSSDSSPLSVTAPLIAPGTPLRAALYRESGLVRRPKPEIRPLAGLGAKTVIRPRASLDHLIGAGEERLRRGKAERVSSLRLGRDALGLGARGRRIARARR